MSKKCPQCGAAMSFETVRDYDDDGRVVYERQSHQIDGDECLRRQLAKAKERIIADLEKMHVHCKHCGGSWLDDGINSGCRCQAAKEAGR